MFEPLESMKERKVVPQVNTKVTTVPPEVKNAPKPVLMPESRVVIPPPPPPPQTYRPKPKAMPIPETNTGPDTDQVSFWSQKDRHDITNTKRRCRGDTLVQPRAKDVGGGWTAMDTHIQTVDPSTQTRMRPPHSGRTSAEELGDRFAKTARNLEEQNNKAHHKPQQTGHGNPRTKAPAQSVIGISEGSTNWKIILGVGAAFVVIGAAIFYYKRYTKS